VNTSFISIFYYQVKTFVLSFDRPSYCQFVSIRLDDKTLSQFVQLQMEF